MKVAIYSITRGDPRIEFIGPIFQAFKRPDVTHIGLHPTLYLDHGRQECVVDFLNSPGKGDWLLFIDDDTSFSGETLDRLFAEAERGGPNNVYGGIYWSPVPGTTDPSNDVFPVVFQRQAGQRESTTYRDHWVHKPYPRGWVAEQTEPFLCDAIGTGFMLISREILIDMAGKYPQPLPHFQMDVLDGVGTGEDLIFCHRAREIGYNIVAVPVPDIYHMKLCRIGRPNFNQNKGD